MGLSVMGTPGLIQQNIAALSKADERFRENAGGDLRNASGQMKEISGEELALRKEQEASRPRILKVNADEIIRNQYSATRDNTTYEIDGVSFSNQQMSDLKAVFKKAVSFLPSKGSDLNYDSYGSMGIASNLVRTFAKSSLNEEQAEVADRAMGDYLKSLAEAQQGGTYRAENNGGASYYGINFNMDEKAADNLKGQIGANSRIADKIRSTLLENISHATNVGCKKAIATNNKLAEAIRSSFSNADLNDHVAVNNLLSQYEDIVTPAYREWGLDHSPTDTSLKSALNGDMKKFSEQILNAISFLKNFGSRINIEL